jgi:hypothetical protein
MATEEVDRYLGALDEPKRGTLEALRRSILEVVPEAEQGFSYGMPAFKVDGKTVAGFAAFTHHLSQAERPISSAAWFFRSRQTPGSGLALTQPRRGAGDSVCRVRDGS